MFAILEPGIMEIDKKILSFLKPELVDKILKYSSVESIPKGTEILKEQEYVKALPIVINGLVRVYSRFDEKELLLYYLEPAQSCVMTFYAAFKNTPSKVIAITEEDSIVLMIPVHLLLIWLKEYPDFNELFYNQFNLRYSELINIIGSLLLNKMDKRLYDHLKKKLELINKDSIKMSHNQLATELGTAREVISRVLKKLETDGRVVQNSGEIKIIAKW